MKLSPVFYQIALMLLGFLAMFKGANWEPFMAGSVVCAAINAKGGA